MPRIVSINHVLAVNTGLALKCFDLLRFFIYVVRLWPNTYKNVSLDFDVGN